MATRSRLGKGLGALFPLLPGEEDEQEEQHDIEAANNSAIADASSSNVSEGVPAEDGHQDNDEASSEKHADEAANKQDVSRETSTKTVRSRQSKQAGKSDASSAKASARKAPQTRKKQSSGTRSHEHVPSEPHDDTTAPSHGKKSNASKRGMMPGFEELSSPSDLFFGVSRETPSDGNGKKEEQSPQKSASAASEPTQQSNATIVQESDGSDGAQPTLMPVSGGYLAELKVESIAPNAQQPRSVFDEEELLELSRSIAEVGVLQPIVVRKKVQPADEVEYELIMGERRWRASQLAGISDIPAIVRTTADNDMLRDALLENLHRVALNPLEEAAAYQQMIDEFGLTQSELSQSVSKSRPQIANMLRLLQLPANVQKKVASGVLSAGHARALLGLQTPEEMDIVANRIISEGLSVRSTEEIVALKTRDIGKSKHKQHKTASVWADSPVMKNLENRFETKVNIKGSEKQGRIEITFSSPEDMTRIVDLLLHSEQTAEGTQTDWV